MGTTPLPQGKLPEHMLAELFGRGPNGRAQLGPIDPSILVGPSVGEDTAAVDVSRTDIITLKSDPITFAGDRIAFYAVTVNANDIVTSGAEPRWFLASVLFPVGTTAHDAEELFSDLQTVCRESGIALCGGHTEITDAVTRTVVSGTMIGTVARGRLLRKTDIRPGQKIMMTKGAGLEGTAVIAREFPDRLRSAGVGTEIIDLAASRLEMISVVDEARIAAEHGLAVAMHDVTEGGVATAVRELCAASGLGAEVDVEAVRILNETRVICSALALDPLGLIGSGSLLVCCRPEDENELRNELADAGIDAAVIGTMTERVGVVSAGAVSAGVVSTGDASGGPPRKFPRFEVDEIAGLYAAADAGDA